MGGNDRSLTFVYSHQEGSRGNSLPEEEGDGYRTRVRKALEMLSRVLKMMGGRPKSLSREICESV